MRKPVAEHSWFWSWLAGPTASNCTTAGRTGSSCGGTLSLSFVWGDGAATEGEKQTKRQRANGKRQKETRASFGHKARTMASGRRTIVVTKRQMAKCKRQEEPLCARVKDFREAMLWILIRGLGFSFGCCNRLG